MTATAEQTRYYRLATPKSLPTGFLEDRRSIYWDNSIPPKDYTKTTPFVLTPRQSQLVYSKQLHPDYVGDRPSPMWPVSPSAMTAVPTPRLLGLARSKQVHPHYQPPREVMTLVPSTALHVHPSARLRRLARHKTYPPLQVKGNTEWDWGEWPSDISQAARTAEASLRVGQLAEAKKDHQLYKPCKQVQWPVTSAALSHIASEHLQKLSQPKNRNSDLEDYNPRAWTVSRAAQLAQGSPRLTELATPLPRKCRPKKQ